MAVQIVIPPTPAVPPAAALARGDPRFELRSGCREEPAARGVLGSLVWALPDLAATS
jgi:hypothetical protein